MANRFTKIYEEVTDTEDFSKGILIKRGFKSTEGTIDNDSLTEIVPLHKLSNKEEEIIKAGLPIYEKDERCFYEPFFKEERIIILGGGHVAVPLSMMAKLVGFYVIVVDDRIEFADNNRFPHADEVICDSFQNALERVKPQANDYLVIITRGHANDRQCLEALANFPEPIYTGLIGSKKRVATVFENLAADGYDKKRFSNIHTPIGLDIGAKTIEEIDVAIIAEIIKVRRKDSIGKGLIDRGDHDLGVLSELARITEPCAIVTILEAKGSTPRNAGAVMAVFDNGSILGSIGGGRVEAAVIDEAKKIIGSNKYQILEVNLDGKSAMAEGMVCGGSLVVLIEDFKGEI